MHLVSTALLSALETILETLWRNRASGDFWKTTLFFRDLERVVVRFHGSHGVPGPWGLDNLEIGLLHFKASQPAFSPFYLRSGRDLIPPRKEA